MVRGVGVPVRRFPQRGGTSLERLDQIAAWLGAAVRRSFAIRSVSALLLLLLLAGCGLGGFFTDTGQAPGEPQLPQVQVGSAKVALLLPLTGQGETQRIGVAMKQAAELAMFDARTPGITLITKDSRGTPEGAAAAAQAALEEGAEIILGPLLASEVHSVSPLARARNVPVVAFSSVSAAAARGTYLLSFLPEEQVANVVRHVAENGRRNIGALVPQSQYGATVERALDAAAKVYGARLVEVERYPPSSEALYEPARRVAAAAAAGRLQAVMIPEGGELLRQLGIVLQQQGFAPGQVKVLGTGLWEDPAINTMPIAIGGWYAGVAPDLVRRFEQRYSQAYGSTPPRLASLAYDAVSLAIILSRDPPGQRFAAEKINNPEGFQGINGLFRFRPDGVSERGLAILEVTPTGPRVVAPAPQRFGFGF